MIDECHLVLNNGYRFRPVLQRLGRLVGAEVQMVLLTATLPPSQEPELWRRMFFNEGQVQLFRESTSRSNIAYHIVDIDAVVVKMPGVETDALVAT